MTQLKRQTNAPWHLRTICDENHSYVYRKTGKGVGIYVLDTGIFTGHKEFEGNREVEIVYSYDGNESDDRGNFSHGTAVASCAAGQTIGPAKEANIYGLRFDMTRRTAIKAVNEMIKHKDDSPAILVKSFGGPMPLFDGELEMLKNHGVILVAASGNESKNLSSFPARRDETISVGSINEKMNLSSFSNYGNTVDLLAPGSDIQCALNKTDRSYGHLDGTSFAAPIVAGVAALACEGKDIRSKKDAKNIKKLIMKNSFKNEIKLRGKQRKTPNKLVNSLLEE